MRFLYPLAAVCIAAVFLTPTTGEAQTAARKLRADQERAIELALKDVEPAMRPMARAATCRDLRPVQRGADRDDGRAR